MRARRFNGRSVITAQKQRGVVLLIALIILVAMTLAGIGMMRSVDTGNLIAGNLAFRQATMNASDAGTSAGFNALVAVANSGATNKSILDSNAGAACPVGATAAGCPGAAINLPGYFPTPINHPANGICEVRNVCTQQSEINWWSVAANWNNAPTITVTDPINGATIATVSYLIHRMCQAAGAPSTTVCQTFTQPESGCSKTQVLPCTSTSIFYRITSRSVGARNTVTYAQTLVLIAQ